MRFAAAQWRTGDGVEVCGTSPSDGAGSGNFEAAALCEDSSYARGPKSTDHGDLQDLGYRVGQERRRLVSLSDGKAYTISSVGAMSFAAGEWTTGDPVSICESLTSDGSIVASIQDPAHYSKIQATRS